MDCSTPGFPVHHQLSELAQALLYLNLYIIIILISSLNRVQLFATPWTVACQAPLDFPGKSPGVGCHFLLQGIFPTQGLNPGLLHCRQMLYCLSHQGSSKMKVKFAQLCLTLCNPMDYTVQGILQARILEWVAFPFPGDLPNPGIEPGSPTLQVDSLPAEPPGNISFSSLTSLEQFLRAI